MSCLYAQKPSEYTIKELCELFGVSKQAYYQYDSDSELRRSSIEEFALEFIRTTRAKDPGIGGMKMWRMYSSEFSETVHLGRDRFCELLDRNGLKLRRRRRRPRTTDSTHGNRIYPNLVKSIIPQRMGEVIVGDITYLPLYAKHGAQEAPSAFCYISLLMDSYCKMVIGYNVGMTLEAIYPMQALTQAIDTLEKYDVNLERTIHHTDRGVQYTCGEYIMMLRAKNIRISMTQSGNPKDNSEAERLNNTLKNELFKDKIFNNIEQVRAALDTAIHFYNHERPHLSLEGRTPYEASHCTCRFKRGWTSYRENAIDTLNEENPTIEQAV